MCLHMQMQVFTRLMHQNSHYINKRMFCSLMHCCFVFLLLSSVFFFFFFFSPHFKSNFFVLLNFRQHLRPSFPEIKVMEFSGVSYVKWFLLVQVVLITGTEFLANQTSLSLQHHLHWTASICLYQILSLVPSSLLILITVVLLVPMSHHLWQWEWVQQEDWWWDPTLPTHCLQLESFHHHHPLLGLVLILDGPVWPWVICLYLQLASKWIRLAF